MSQNNAIKWSRAVQPYMGGSYGLILAAFISGKESLRLDGYKRTGDICLQYTDGAYNQARGVYENSTRKLPPSKIRCLSQQFRWGSDASTMVACMNLDGAVLGRNIRNLMLTPMLKLLPGGLNDYIGPQIDTLLGGHTKKMLQEILWNLEKIAWKTPDGGGKTIRNPLMLVPGALNLGSAISFALTTVDDNVEEMFGFSFRNILTEEFPREIVAPYTALVDYAIDADQARMARVYSRDGKQSCDADASLNSMTGDCPSAIPVRDANLAGARAGDIASYATDTYWPHRRIIQQATARSAIVYIKSSLCIKLPVCDLHDQPQYDLQKRNNDCSGHGQCMWNMALGNHCQCDQGFYWLHGYHNSKANTITEDSKGDVRYRQKCCKIGISKQECLLDESNNIKTAAKPIEPSQTRESKEAGSARWPTSGVGTIPDAIMDVVAPMVVQEVDRVLGNETTAVRNTASRSLLQQKYGTLGDSDGQGTEATQTQTYKQKPDDRIRRLTSDTFLTPRLTPRGPEMISRRCTGLTGVACRKAGCEMAAVLGDHVCVDATSWQCGGTKKVVDCKSYRGFAPSNMHPVLDQDCGKTMFMQKKVLYRGCHSGIRRAQQCLLDTDCPYPTATEMDFAEQPGVEPHSKPTQPFEKYERWYNVSNDNRQECKGSFEGCRRYAVCRHLRRYVGCQATVMNDCKLNGNENFGAMAI